MRLKIDENLPEGLVVELSSCGHDVDNVRLEGLAGQEDPAVWTAAQAASRFFITQDLDFSDVRRFAPGTHCGLLLVRLPEFGARGLSKRLVEIFRAEDVESWAHCFVVLSTHKLRVLRPAI